MVHKYPRTRRPLILATGSIINGGVGVLLVKGGLACRVETGLSVAGATLFLAIILLVAADIALS